MNRYVVQYSEQTRNVRYSVSFLLIQGSSREFSDWRRGALTGHSAAVCQEILLN